VSGLAEHCLDVPFWFDCLDEGSVRALAGPTPPQALATELHARAVDFIANGEPGWPAWNAGTQTDRVFDATSLDATSFTERGGYAGTVPLLDA
jgi:para-nitrobenzyl esterase